MGLALLGYLPGYAIAVSLSLGFHPGQNYLALIPMLSDQLLLGILNLGLLSIPAERDRSRLEEAALRDPLTGAWNRTALVAQTPSLTRAGAVVVAIDIDHFKAINDRYGHATGDDVLLALTRRSFVLLEQQGGKLFRMGGDEFIAVLPQNTLSEARAFAIRLRQWPDETGQLPPWTISVGLSQIEPRDRDFKTALKRADQSLYDAKELGRDRIAA
ncbi:GGDEF domain-containing protein [Sphingomonas nostoxanthinifaciens]|uniref:GGDEF domain-containing protein n=1 Tax=Sphingomonas nostoxanthinifaciens TaxID=2872652 RepID=UPI001CC21B56|nr:GGDEF domain-containing protein [Sphingomonas nostoxanthinifaciens]UAK25699.1 GGDEF domain-containing protein [Sphingomonas nostoxanthinifaciens]